jgi:hypothetical protein
MKLQNEGLQRRRQKRFLGFMACFEGEEFWEEKF